MVINRDEYYDLREQLISIYTKLNNKSEIFDSFHYIISNVLLKIKHNNYELLYNNINMYLISGFICLEYFHTYYRDIDVCSLMYKYENNDYHWVQLITKDKIRKIDKDKIIYIPNYDDNISYLHSVVNGLIDINDKGLLDDIIQKMSDKIINYKLDISKILFLCDNIKRRMKLNKIIRK